VPPAVFNTAGTTPLTGLIEGTCAIVLNDRARKIASKERVILLLISLRFIGYIIKTIYVGTESVV
jgi:hypothetical protein